MISKQQFDTLFMAALILLGGAFVYSAQGNELPPQEEEGVRVIVEEEKDPFETLSIIAPSVFVYDIRDNKVLFSKNSDEQMALASLTKLMSVIVAKEELGEDEVIYITPDAIELEGDNGLFLNEAWPAEELLALTLVSSSNDGTRAIRNHIQTTKETDLIDLMNAKAKELNMLNTYFINETGLDVSEKVSGAYGSASDFTKLLTYAYKKHSDILADSNQEQIRVSSINYGEHILENTNKIAGNIPSLVISKTGFTDIAGGNLAIVFEKEPAHPVAVVVLGSTIEGRFSDVDQLVWAAIEK